MNGKKRKTMTPREARTFKQICAMPRDGLDSTDFWFSVAENSVTICEQKVGAAATVMLTIPRQRFNRFIDWYNTGEMPKRRRSASPTERRPEE